MKRLIRSLLSKLNLKIVRENKFKEILEDSKYKAFYEIIRITNSSKLIKYVELSKSERFQDIFVIGLLKEKENGYFVEFGAADGIFCSNTHILENEFGWKGILAEPAKIWHQRLYENRKCHISKKCIYEKSGQLVEFSEAKYPGLSTITKFTNNDNHAIDRSDSERYKVETISLNELLAENNAPNYIDYISIDTEGSEYEVLKNLNFKKYRFGIMQIEHNNNEENRMKIHILMKNNGYRVIEQNVASFNDFFVEQNFKI